ncbi:putative transcription cofactor [Corchorus olitorius]|uniref:Transcription cofactor n=1 Tax=Corchorus olitorius TaxID=93759 RepID=A0A1R3K314_9ROSI|nr:putative transcription cofactor [Corchorus olitorius]
MENPNPSPTQPTMNTVDWRSQLSLDYRKKIMTLLIKKLEQTIPFSGQRGLIELKKFAIKLEHKIFADSTSQPDYLKRVSDKMRGIEMIKMKKTAQLDTGNNSEPPCAGSQGMQQQQNQIHSQGQTIHIPQESNQSQACQQLLPQNVQNNMAPSGFQSGMPPVSCQTQNPIPNFGGQNISGISQNSTGQGMPSHIYSIQQRQMQGVQQSMNLQGSVPKMQNNAGQGNALCSMQNGTAPRPLHQNPASASQQANISSLSSQSHNGASVRQQNMNTLQSIVASSTSQQANTSSLSSQSGVNVPQQNMNPIQSNLYELRQQYLKQKQEWQMLQSQSQQRQMQSQQYYQQVKQEFPTQEFQTRLMPQAQQYYHQQVKQEFPTQEFQTHHMPQTQQHQQMNNVNDMKIRPGMGVKPGVFPQHLPAGQRHQQFRPGSQFPISSPDQRLQVASPKHSSPKVDQQRLLTSIAKTRTPLQSANSPFAVPSPSTPLAPLPMPGESEKPVPSTSTLSDAANTGHQQGTGVHAVSGPVKINTPGISALPLLADDTHDTASTPAVPSKSNSTEQPPLERLINAVQSMSPVALRAAVSDIASVVIMSDSIAESAPGYRSRAAIAAAATSGGDTTGAASDQRQPWQLRLDLDSRLRVVNRMMDLLKSYKPTRLDKLSQEELDEVMQKELDEVSQKELDKLSLEELDEVLQEELNELRLSQEELSQFEELEELSQEILNKLRRISVTFEEKIYSGATSQSDYLRKITNKMLCMERKSKQAALHLHAAKRQKIMALRNKKFNDTSNQHQLKYYQFLEE